MLFESAHINMIEQQIRPWNVLEMQTLTAFSAIQREHFVADKNRDFAYTDMRIALTDGETMLEPKLVTRMVESDPRFIELLNDDGFIISVEGREPAMQMVKIAADGNKTSYFETCVPYLRGVTVATPFKFNYPILKTIRRIFQKSLYATLGMVFSVAATATDLQTIYQQALQNDSEFAAAISLQQSAALGVSLAKGAFRPNLSISLNKVFQQTELSSGSQPSTNENLANVNISQLVYDRAQWLGIDTSKKQADMAILQLQSARQNLIIKTATRYFNVLAALDEQQVARTNKAAIFRQMSLAEAHLNVGLGTTTDLFDAQARYRQAQAEEARTDSQISTRFVLLAEVVGYQPGKLNALQKETPLLLPAPADMGAWKARANGNNLAVQIAQIDVDTAQKQVAITRAQTKYPVVSLRANQGHSNNVDNKTSSDNRSVNLNVDIPLYMGGTGNIKVDRAKLNLMQKQYALEDTKRRTTTQVISAYLAISNGISRIQALAKAVIAGESALLAKQEGFRAGLTTNIDVLNAQRDLSRSKTDLLRSRYDYVLSMLQLELVVGNLDEYDVKKVNRWLIP